MWHPPIVDLFQTGYLSLRVFNIQPQKLCEIVFRVLSQSSTYQPQNHIWVLHTVRQITGNVEYQNQRLLPHKLQQLLNINILYHSLTPCQGVGIVNFVQLGIRIAFSFVYSLAYQIHQDTAEHRQLYHYLLDRPTTHLELPGFQLDLTSTSLSSS